MTGIDLHRVADMHGVIRIRALTRRMPSSHRRHDGDREYGKHGEEAREHLGKIGTGHGNVHLFAASNLWRKFIFDMCLRLTS